MLILIDEPMVDGQVGAYALDYRQAIEAAGGFPVPFFYGDYGTTAIPAHDGVITIGGADVDPAAYSEDPAPRLGPTCPPRDVAELAITRAAVGGHVPLLAICRGMQLLNVACGGSLLQHIEDEALHNGPAGTDESAWHPVTVSSGTLLESISGGGRFLVNSRHHQAVTIDRVAPGVHEAARADHGDLVIVEAIEVIGHPFALGVQWHPERPEMTSRPAPRPMSTCLFEAFVAACAAT